MTRRAGGDTPHVRADLVFGDHHEHQRVRTEIAGQGSQPPATLGQRERYHLARVHAPAHDRDLVVVETGDESLEPARITRFPRPRRRRRTTQREQRARPPDRTRARARSRPRRGRRCRDRSSAAATSTDTTRSVTPLTSPTIAPTSSDAVERLDPPPREAPDRDAAPRPTRSPTRSCRRRTARPWSSCAPARAASALTVCAMSTPTEQRRPPR